MRPGRSAAVVGAVLCLAAVGEPADRLGDPAKEHRARALFRETRCLVCQGQSIDESDAPLASDLRRMIREEVAGGQTNSQIRRSLAARYGDFVLLRPPFTVANSLIWLGPFAVLGLGVALLTLRSRRVRAPAPLSPEEEDRLQALEDAESP